MEKELRSEYSGSDEGISIHCENAGSGEFQVLHPVSGEKAVFLLNFMPWGIQKMSGNIPGLVENIRESVELTKLDEDEFLLEASVRSSVGSAKHAVSEKIAYLAALPWGHLYHFRRLSGMGVPQRLQTA